MSPNGPAAGSPLPPEHRAIAAEYALGLLSPDEADRAAAQAAANPAFALEVEHWRRHFSGLDRTSPMARLPPDLRSRIEAKRDGALALAGA